VLDKEEINEKIDCNYIRNILCELIKIKSVNPPENNGEEEIAKFLCTEMKKLGLKVHFDKVAPGRANAIGELEGKGEGPTCILNGHLDVVPAKPELWNTDPFMPEIKNGRMYGRGTSDMKGAIASMLGAIKYICEENVDFKGKLILSFVCDEETGNMGVNDFLKKYPPAQCAIIGEPTNLKVEIGHRGMMSILVKTFGVSGHASEPDYAVNAIYKMKKVLEEIQLYAEELKKRKHNSLPLPTIAVTKIQAGDKINVIPSSCEITMDRRSMPGETREGVLKEIESIFERIKKDDSNFSYSIEAKEHPYIPPAQIDLDSEFLKKIKKLYSEYFSVKTDHFNYFRAGCEQVYFLSKGIDTVVFGPGNVSQAHTVNEYIEIEQLYKAAGFYAFCVLNQ